MASAVVHAQLWWLVPLGSTLPCPSLFSISFSRDQQELFEHAELGDLLYLLVVS